jgi:hypothetical protein
MEARGERTIPVIYVAAAAAVIAFMIAFERLRVADVARRALATSGRGTAALRDPMLSDDEKERLLRQASISLGRDVLAIGARGAGALLASLLPLLVLDFTGVTEFEIVLAWMGTWQTILLISAAIAVWAVVRRRW